MSQGVKQGLFLYEVKTYVILHPVAMDATPACSGHASAVFHVVNITVATSMFFCMPMISHFSLFGNFTDI